MYPIPNYLLCGYNHFHIRHLYSLFFSLKFCLEKLIYVFSHSFHLWKKTASQLFSPKQVQHPKFAINMQVSRDAILQGIGIFLPHGSDISGDVQISCKLYLHRYLTFYNYVCIWVPKLRQKLRYYNLCDYFKSRIYDYKYSFLICQKSISFIRISGRLQKLRYYNLYDYFNGHNSRNFPNLNFPPN